ncbi:MAG: hypothetical protein QOE97_2001 [Pseudonocardiales bacterium]|nr:hypothetical protein [Pseudonocardiales bacterium]
MRVRAWSIGLAAALLLAGCASATPSSRQAGPSSRTTPVAGPAGADGATRVVVLRPVTRVGAPATGYTAVPDAATGLTIDCTQDSPVSVDAGIASCSPSASYAVACWPSATAGHALCLRDPWSRQVASVPMQGTFPAGVGPPATPQPIGLELADGSHCTIRGGGAGEVLDGHPAWYARYYCGANYDTAAWAPSTSPAIDRSEPSWTVQVARSDGHAALRTVRVATAYLVGTATR